MLWWPFTLVEKCQFLPLWRLLFFSLMSYPAKIAYISSPNRELSNFVQLKDLCWIGNVRPSSCPCLKTVDGMWFERCKFLVLRPILLKKAYFSWANRQLSIDVWLVQWRQRKVVVHTFWGGPKLGCSDSVHAGIIESPNFFVLLCIMVKLHIRSRLIESFPTMYDSWRCAEEKFHFTLVHTLYQLKRYEGLFSPLRTVIEFRAWYRQIPVPGFWG